MSYPNAEQQAVLDHRHGTLLVLAPAGTGKTRVMADRVIRRRLFRFSLFHGHLCRSGSVDVPQNPASSTVRFCGIRVESFLVCHGAATDQGRIVRTYGILPRQSGRAGSPPGKEMSLRVGLAVGGLIVWAVVVVRRR